jgi:Helitron helicase-like domain at N-terminus
MFFLGGLSYFIFDHIADEAITNHALSINSEAHIIYPEVAKYIKEQLLKSNPYCQDLNFIGRILDETDALPFDAQNDGIVRARLRNEVQYFDVAHFSNDRATGPRVLTVSPKNSTSRTVDMSQPIVEPLCYPLLHMNGELGWGDSDQKNISFPRYLASRLLKPEYLDDTFSDFLTMPNQHDCEENPRSLTVNRFQIMPRLAQTYMVDMVSRMIDKRLNFISRNQDKIMMGQKRSHDDGSDEDDDDEDPNSGYENDKDFTFLPSSFHGSARHRKKLALNALSIVSELGAPTAFITGTCNVKWPEIQSQLGPGQTAFDRPDVVTQVFRTRLSKFIHNIKSGKSYHSNLHTEFFLIILL